MSVTRIYQGTKLSEQELIKRYEAEEKIYGDALFFIEYGVGTRSPNITEVVNQYVVRAYTELISDLKRKKEDCRENIKVLKRILEDPRNQEPPEKTHVIYSGAGTNRKIKGHS